MGFFSKKNKENENIITSSKQVEVPDKIEDIKQEDNAKEEKWIWIDGFKATNKNLNCKGFQFEIGQMYIHHGQIEDCKSGFHLSLNPKDITSYYIFDLLNRFFKVKALVKENDFNNYKYNLVAKEIQLVSEFTIEEYYDLYNIVGINEFIKTYPRPINDEYFEIYTLYTPYIKTFDDFKRTFNLKSYDLFKKQIFRKSLIECNAYSDTFIIWLLDIIKISDDTYEKAIALAHEEISHDMRIMLLLQNEKLH